MNKENPEKKQQIWTKEEMMMSLFRGGLLYCDYFLCAVLYWYGILIQLKIVACTYRRFLA